MNRFLPTDPRLRAAVLYGGFALALLVFTQVVLPGPSGLNQRGTPWATMFVGLVDGMVASLAAAGLVLVYRTQRIINFAQTTIGIAGAFFTFGLVTWTEVPFPLALVFGLALSTASGVVVGVVLLRFSQASRLVLTVVTIIGSILIVLLASNIYRLPFFPDFNDLPLGQQTGAYDLRPFLPFEGWSFTIGGLRPGFGFAEAFALELSFVCLVALAAFFRFTRSGVAVRALAQNSERASLLGIGVGTLSIVVWALSGFLSGASTMLTGMLSTPATSGGLAPRVLLAAFAAAAIGRFERFVPTVVAAVSISIVTRAWTWSFPDDEPLIFVGMFLVLSVALLVQRGGYSRSETGAAVTWAAVDEQRPVPKVLAALAPVRAMRWGFYLIAAVALVVTPFVFSTSVVSLLSTVYLFAIATLSVVVLTGWAGQVSLGQWAFAAIGAVIAGALTATSGVSFWFAVPIAAVSTSVLSAIVGVPALRLKGLFLLPVTFAFAVAVQATLFDERYFGWLLPTKPIERPQLLFLDFRDETSMYFLCAACLVLAMVVVANLRRSRTGRVLIALRENEANVQSFGIPVVRTKLVAFAIAGALSGFAGAVYSHQQQGLNVESFPAFKSVLVFGQAVLGGVGSIVGALLGSAFYQIVSYLELSALLATFATGFFPLFVIYAAPGGLVSVVNAVRDSILRVIAQRRHLVVPSLFADYDPDALERRLIPLGEMESSAGLAALPSDRRFVLRSRLYRSRQGERARGDEDLAVLTSGRMEELS